MPLKLLNLNLPEPYLKEPKQPQNALGLPDKPYYFTRDVCKALGITPDAFRKRIHKGHYPEYEKKGSRRIFTLDQIKELVRITEGLVINSV